MSNSNNEHQNSTNILNLSSLMTENIRRLIQAVPDISKSSPLKNIPNNKHLCILA
jgi:hypothetical protein